MYVIVSAITFDEKSPFLVSLSLSSYEKSQEKQVGGGEEDSHPPGLDRVSSLRLENNVPNLR